MTSFENFIRPFQRTDVSPFRTQIPTTPTGATGPATVVNVWGEVGTIKSFSGSRSVSASYYVIRRPEEMQGTTTATGP